MNPDHSATASAVLKEGASTTDAAAHARMDPELKAKWVAALRSGEYEQTRDSYFDSGNRYCVVGVFMCVASGTRGLTALEAVPLDYMERTVSRKGLRQLWDMNDGANGQVARTFPEIADWIEANL